MKYIAVDNSVSEVIIGKVYIYMYRGRLRIGKAVNHPKKTWGYNWAMQNCITNRTEYPYYKDIIDGNSIYYEVYAEIKLREK